MFMTDASQGTFRGGDTLVPWWAKVTPAGSLALLRAAITLAVLLAWVLLPDQRVGTVIAFGIALVALTVVELAVAARLRRQGRIAGVVRALAPAAGGLVLLLAPVNDLTRLDDAAGVLLLVRAAGDATAAYAVGRRLGLRPWLVGLALSEAVVGAAALVLTDLFGQAALVTVAFAWLAGGVMVALTDEPRRVRELTIAPVPRRASMNDVERERIAQEVYFDGPGTRDRLVRFVVLLTIATVIATYGVLSDSVAAVIGGMIVAPLMVPMQALAAGLVAGATRRAWAAAVVLVCGIGLVLVLAMLIAATSRDLESSLLNAQVVSRTSPNLADLAIALAAGAAGGFALVRKDVSGSLPGVAIAVSLVPPLCVAGATLAGGEGASAVGALLLFTINFFAIVIASGAILLVAGFGVVKGGSSHRLVTVSVALGVSLALLVVPLATEGADLIRREALDSAVRTELADWLEPVQPAQVVVVDIDGERVTVLVASVQQPPSTSSLEELVAAEVGREVDVKIDWIPATRLP